MQKIDLKKKLKSLYNPSAKEISVVDVPAMNFLMIDGSGYPGTSQSYKDAVEALYGMSYTLKFMLKGRETCGDWVVLPLEGLWWLSDMSKDFTKNKDDWQWTSMIMQPDFVTGDHIKEATAQLRKKKNPVALDEIRFESFDEGLAVQIMYIGPYENEDSTIKRLHGYIADNGNERAGKHHEIYLSDPRRSTPEKLKTIIRQPMRKM